MDRFDLVIFDCDGVLIDSELISARMLVAELAQYGVQIDLGYVARHFLGRSYPIVLSQIRAEFGIALPPGFEADYRHRLIAAFQTELKIMPGVRQVIADLAPDYCLATSSSPPRLAESLRIVGLDRAFAGRTATASEVARGKPAPDLFLHAASKFGADPARCLVIEDSLAGIRAGLAAGMQVWRFVGGSHLSQARARSVGAAEPHREFASFDEFYHLAPNLRKKGSANGAA